MKQLHEGHRERLRKRFLEEGLDAFTEIEVLELLLFYCIPRKNTNEIAHLLLNRFGSFTQVLEASPADLKQVDGMGDISASFISLIPAAARYYGVARVKQEKVLKTLDACGEYLLEYFKGLSKETVYLLCLDAKCKVLGCPWIGEGNVNSASIPIRRVVEMALALNATAVVLAHNHPSGIALPSQEDIATTKKLAMALSGVDIVLADHIVIADGDYTSMTLSGKYRAGECTLNV